MLLHLRNWRECGRWLCCTRAAAGPGMRWPQGAVGAALQRERREEGRAAQRASRHCLARPRRLLLFPDLEMKRSFSLQNGWL